jgi:two-component system, LytTR family, sensor kinase
MHKFWKHRIDHVLFWIATTGFHMYTRRELLDTAGWEQFILEIVIRNGLLAAMIYTHLLILIPRLAQRQRIGMYVIAVIGLIVLYALGKNGHDVYLYNHIKQAAPKSFFDNTYYNISIGIFYLAFSVALHLSKEWYIQRKRLQQIEIEKLNTELEYLKSQINPHFVFNSINTIFFQIDKQNTAARETLSRFSEMLRYQLYECNGKDIPIEKELTYLLNYIELQRLRKDDNYIITFDSGEGVKDFSIAPLLMIVFVENAFKHVSNYSDRNNEISISLQRSDSAFTMKVTNTKDSHVNGKAVGGIGLRNVKRRLDLLYNGSHTLHIQDNPGLYSVELSIGLRSKK